MMFWSERLSDPAYLAQIRETLARDTRAHLPDFLAPEPARFLRGAMEGLDWRLITNQGGTTKDFAPDELANGGEAAVMQAVHEEAKRDFRFAYDGYRLADACLSQRLTSGPFYEFFVSLNTPQAIDMFRALTGEPNIVYLDAIVSRYRAGHFLTAHTDDEVGGERLYAYVFNFSPEWRSDWGGLLGFIGAEGHITDAYTPRIGALNIFKVPQPHTVTTVAAFAGADRYSITGWMRAKRPGLRARDR